MNSKRIDTERTWIGCVLFADIAAYSMRPVTQQMDWKLLFNDFLNEALPDIELGERYVLDTGDGAAICFLGAPESAVETALKLQHLVTQAQGAASGMHIRIGINLGPLRLLRDVNGAVNAVGDAMNVSQRVMNFAKLDQILVSRSFYEAVSRLSEESARMFSPAGTQTDKHGRAHVLYELSHTPASSTFATNYKSELERLRQLLTPITGPIAERLVEQEAAKSRNIEEFAQRLTTHLPAESTCEVVLKKWVAELGHAGPEIAASRKDNVSAATALSLDPTFSDRAAKELARFIGPMAKIIVARVAERCKSSKELVDALCEEIQSEKDRESFRRSVVQSTLPEAKTK